MVELETEILWTRCSTPALFDLVTVLTLNILRYPLAERKSIQIQRATWYIYIHNIFIYIYVYFSTCLSEFSNRVLNTEEKIAKWHFSQIQPELVKNPKYHVPLCQGT